MNPGGGGIGAGQQPVLAPIGLPQLEQDGVGFRLVDAEYFGSHQSLQFRRHRRHGHTVIGHRFFSPSANLMHDSFQYITFRPGGKVCVPPMPAGGISWQRDEYKFPQETITRTRGVGLAETSLVSTRSRGSGPAAAKRYDERGEPGGSGPASDGLR